MVSFAQLWEQLEKEKLKSPLMGGDSNGPSMAILKAGVELRHDKQTSFWDELISLCANPQGLSELLGVSKETITSWPAKIKNGLSDLESKNPETSNERENKKLIPTGMTGAVTTNQDPNMGDML